jgi:hypothetical protein
MRRLIPILRQWWYRNHPSEDEFAPCYSFDPEYLIDIREKALYYQAMANEWWEMERWYNHDLTRRREVAHRKDMEKEE